MSDKSPGSGHHQRSASGNYYTSGPASDPKAPGGHFVSTGDAGGHTTHLFDAGGNHVSTSTTGGGGPAANVPAGGKK